MAASKKRSGQFKPLSKSSFLSRHWHVKHFLIGALVIIIVIAGLFGYSKYHADHRQNQLQPFYNTAGLSLAGPMGQVVRSEPLGVQVQNGSALRVLYRSQQANGTATFSSGMVFIPNNDNSGTPRPVVAWAHGTVGMGDQCAPSRTQNPTSNIDWVNAMLAKGWVVTATDYAGLGTPGTEGYLVGGDEAKDVLNSVRALQYIPSAHAGATFAVFGHSQGGHSALFTAAEASTYAPDLHLVGTVAAAPAAELVALLNETSGTTLDWVIGPEVLESWPPVYPGLNPQAVTTKFGYNNYKKIANQCIVAAALQGQVRNKFKQQFFSTDVAKIPAWNAAAQSETAPILAPPQPVLVAESLSDKVVLPNTTALYIKQACQAGSDLTSIWINNVSHQDIPSIISPQVISWINSRFQGQASISNCGQALPVTPAAAPTT
ncbi:MAG TPA: alpha/beta fold hydrolase [Candidatus Saccharimonadales bacterium]|nr:alpha/beta fold hydrolase [Candidatus Saccharimonadales bacterium]